MAQDENALSPILSTTGSIEVLTIVRKKNKGKYSDRSRGSQIVFVADDVDALYCEDQCLILKTPW